MNICTGNDRSFRLAGMSLLEMIGVLAIIAILAGVLAPNVVRTIDRSAVAAERESLKATGDQLKLYLRDRGSLPTPANWTTELADYADLHSSDLATNRRQMPRRFLLDPASSPALRVLLLSSMRNGLSLPTAADINTAAEFDAVWNTGDGAVPPVSTWTGWNAWSAVAGAADYLVLERVNLRPVYSTDLLSLTVTLNNLGSTTVSYNLVSASGAAGAAVDVAPGGTIVLSNLRPRERINLFAAAGGNTLDYSHVLTAAGGTFDFDGSQWIPR